MTEESSVSLVAEQFGPSSNLDEIQEIRNNIEFIIQEITCLAETQLDKLKPYTHYLALTFKDLLFDLKREIYVNQLEGQLVGDVESN